MKPRTLLLLLLCASLGSCGLPERTTSIRHAPRLPSKGIPPVAQELMTVGADLRDAERQMAALEGESAGARMAHELMTAGADLRDAKRQMADLSSVVFFLECLKRRTGKKVDGAVLERHIRRNTKDARACQNQHAAMSESDRADYTKNWVAKQDAEKAKAQ